MTDSQDGDGGDPLAPSQAIEFSTFGLHISPARLVLMTLATMSLYQFYWQYQSWSEIKRRRHLSIRPLWRAIFGYFWMYPLLKSLNRDRQARAIIPGTYAAGGLAAGWILLNLCSTVVSRIDDVAMSFLAVGLSVASVCFLLPVQTFVNAVHEQVAPRAAPLGWTRGQWILLAVGLLLWALALLGLSLAPRETGPIARW